MRPVFCSSTPFTPSTPVNTPDLWRIPLDLWNALKPWYLPVWVGDTLAQTHAVWNLQTPLNRIVVWTAGDKIATLYAWLALPPATQAAIMSAYQVGGEQAAKALFWGETGLISRELPDD
mgnify:CR=1 FL=1